jgi:hypothetical protein
LRLGTFDVGLVSAGTELHRFLPTPPPPRTSPAFYFRICLKLNELKVNITLKFINEFF